MVLGIHRLQNQNYPNDGTPLRNSAEGVKADGLKTIVKHGTIEIVRHKITQKPDRYVKGSTLGNYYIHRGDKELGTEPGFWGYKSWKSSDFSKLADDKHKFHDHALRHILDRVNQRDPIYNKAIANVRAATRSLQLSGSSLIKTLVQMRDHENAEIKDSVNLLLKDLIGHIMYSVPAIHKFKIRHWVKNDYYDPKNVGKRIGVVKLPFFRTKAPKFFGALGRKLHQKFTSGTVREKNFSAVTESLANDLYKTMGILSQKLRIVETKYDKDPRYAKLLLDGTDVGDQYGTQFHTLHGQIKKGYLVENSVTVKENGIETTYPLDEKQLAAFKVVALLMGDRDKIGSSGRNVGFIIKDSKAVLVNIDPGKSIEGTGHKATQANAPKRMPGQSVIAHLFKRMSHSFKYYFAGITDRMRHHNIHSDLSFDQPNATIADKLTKGYKNFTIFDDTLLADRVEGLKTVKQNWENVEKVFEEYIQAYGTNRQGQELDFSTELAEMRQKLRDRKEYFLNVLDKRVNLTRDELNLIDGLEKLSSNTRNSFTLKGKKVYFKHLLVEHKSRKKWDMHLDPNGEKVFVHNAPDLVQSGRQCSRLRRYLHKQGLSKAECKELVKKRGKKVKLYVKDDAKLAILLAALEESKIAKAKKQKLA